MEKFSIRRSHNGIVVIVTITGEVDSATAPAMDSELERAVNENNKVVLNLKEVEFMSSAGVRAVIKALRTADKLPNNIKLACVPKPIVEKILTTIGVTGLVQIYPSVEEAIASF